MNIMMPDTRERIGIQLLLSLLLVCLICCTPQADPPDTDSSEYRDAVSHFYLALAASQTDEQRFAHEQMSALTQLYPLEAAAWANLGVIAMRRGSLDQAVDYLEEAISIEPEHAELHYLAGLIRSRRGDLQEAVDHYRTASELDPEHTFSRYALVVELERIDSDAHAEEVYHLLEEIHYELPDNQVVIYELARVAIREGDLAEAGRWLERLSASASDWSDEGRDQYAIVMEVLEEEDLAELSLEMSFLRNAIEPLPVFQGHMNHIRLDPNELGRFITHFLWLPEPRFKAAEPDLEITFSHAGDELEPFPEYAAYVRSLTLLGDRPPFAVHIDGSSLWIDEAVQLQYPGDPTEGPVSPDRVIEIDYNYNFMNDLAMAGEDGFRLYRQNEDETFTNVTDELGLPDAVREGAYRGAWTADVDQDGDLDILLAPLNGEIVLLRNNGDGTFSTADQFDGMRNVVDFIWADLNGEGLGDALFLSVHGELNLLEQRPGGQFVHAEEFPAGDNVIAVTVSDINADGWFDVIVLRENGSIERIYWERSHGQWEAELLVDTDLQGDEWIPESSSLFSVDLDNNGAFDLILTNSEETHIWLADSHLVFEPMNEPLPGRVISIFDIDGNERLDLLGLTAEGETFRLMNKGAKGYGARSIRARASGIEGDQRINSFGIGGEMEVRSGLLYQKQLISSPIVHFGLGEYEEAEMLRIIWPNGSVQAEFQELGMETTILNEQLLKGSCPWLFSYDGEEYQFVTDAIWRSPLGLRVAEGVTADVQTHDRVRVSGDLLNEHDGVYDLRMTAELWETHYFDYVDLIAVDHPEGTEIYIDERFTFPEPDLSTRLVRETQPVRSVHDGQGRNVTDTVRETDGHYLKAFDKTRYQGLVEEHTIEIDIGDDAPDDTPIYLVASGWLRPTDSSINIALSQSRYESPKGLRVEVSDGSGGWILLHDDYGVPAGKLKTILIDLDGKFPDPEDRRIRLWTTSEIYWDSIRWAEALPNEQLTERSLTSLRQELRFRGYSEWERADDLSPKLPTYGEISGTTPRWRDLEGYYTRFGDVSELLSEIDDRYVIMNAGDELVLQFESPGEPKEGWIRSYVFVSDGWVKDGDYHTEAPRTVGPLPYHGQDEYLYRPGSTLMDDPVYQRHRHDWVRYHTRYVTPLPFIEALVFDH